MAIKFTEKSLRTVCLPPTDKAQAYYWDDEVPGFGVVVGRTGKRTFIARGGGRETRRKVTIGEWGAQRPDGHHWSVTRARAQAVIELGLIQSGEGDEPTADPADGPTLQKAMEAHVARMTKKGRAKRSIETFENEITKYFADWLDRPIAELTGEVLADAHDRIKREAKARAGTNPLNGTGAALANRVITHVSAAWNTLNQRMQGGLGTWNPAKAVDKDKLKPKRQRIADEDLPDWSRRVETMRNPIQRDGLYFALFTGLRSEDVRTAAWPFYDAKARTLSLPDPKGGEAAAFTIPLSPTAVEILNRRRTENEKNPVIASAGGDNGFVFPSIDSERLVVPIGDLRQQVHGDTHGRFPAEDVHTLRRTWESVAHEEGISELDQHVLSNHSFGSHNVNATYIAQHIDHLARCAAKIDAGLRRRLGWAPLAKARARAKRPA